MMFKPVSSSLDVIKMEEGVLDFWQKQDIFHKSGEQREGQPEYVFYEGPPTANGRPGVHHVLARAFKDIFPRYKTMQGYHVSRRGGLHRACSGCKGFWFYYCQNNDINYFNCLYLLLNEGSCFE